MRRVLLSGVTMPKVLHLWKMRSRLVECIGEYPVTLSLVLQEQKGIGDATELRMGIRLAGVTTQGKRFTFFNGHSSLLCNPVCWWRAMQFLEAAPVINQDLFHIQCYWGGDPAAACPFPEARAAVRQAVGEAAFGAIMRRQVLQQIVDLLPQLAAAGLELGNTLRCLSDEIEAGTLEWSQPLRQLGVKHPDYWRCYQVARQALLQRYTSYLLSYADFRGYPYGTDDQKGGLMLDIEGFLIDGVERGIEQDYGKEIACALAIVRAEAAYDDLMAQHPKDQTQRLAGRPLSVSQHIQHVIAWLIGSLEAALSEDERWLQEEAYALVQRLTHEIEHLPVISPLVDL